jgi:hypothetical protein
MIGQNEPTGNAPTLGSDALLAAFGSKILDELMQGEWEPDFEWREKILELAQKHGLLTTRPADQDDDPEEFDFMWERLAPVVPFPLTIDLMHADPTAPTPATTFPALHVGHCSVCGDPAWGGTKRHPATKCFLHFGCVCAECGHEAFWLTTKKHPAGHWVCFSLQCDWASTEYTKPFHQPNIEATDPAATTPNPIES